MRLFVDDIRMPLETDWVVVRSGEIAIKLLSLARGGITIISLDHDLGEGKMTGYDVAKWIERQVFTDDYYVAPLILVHSANPVGAKNIQDCIDAIKGKLCQRASVTRYKCPKCSTSYPLKGWWRLTKDDDPKPICPVCDRICIEEEIY